MRKARTYIGFADPTAREVIRKIERESKRSKRSIRAKSVKVKVSKRR